MASYCRTSPVVYKKEGKTRKEVDSQLFKDIQEATGDYNMAWNLWAYTKTAQFKTKYKEVQYDELGEVTFPSLVKALGLENEYNEQKSANNAAKEYGFSNKVFDSASEAVRSIEEFNAKEKRFVATVQKTEDKYTIKVEQKTGSSIDKARQQTYNSRLTTEIIGLLRTLGFDVSVLNDAKFDGLFDPEHAELVDGLIQIIRIAKGERGEEALPEEFSHLIIRGLRHIPLVSRLLNTIDENLAKEVLGNQYEQYVEEYQDDPSRIKEEVAGKLLAQHIKKEGTINPKEVSKRKGLLSRIWSWVKNLFGRVSNQQLNNIRTQVYDDVAELYNMVTSREIIPYIDKNAIMSGRELAKISAEYDSIEKIANMSRTIQVRLGGIEMAKSQNRKMNNATYEDIADIQALEKVNEFPEATVLFLDRTKTRANTLIARINLIKKEQEKNPDRSITALNDVAGVVLEARDIIEGYNDFTGTLSIIDQRDKWMSVQGLDQDSAHIIAHKADMCQKLIRELEEFVKTTTLNVLYDFARTEYRGDKERSIGSRRQEIMSLWTILKHAERDIGFVDHMLSALYDCDDSLLSIVDGLVKNQKYERDLEMIKISTEINALDRDLRRAGHTSDFIYELNEKGEPIRLKSIYDWDTFKKEKEAYAKKLRDRGLYGKDFRIKMHEWMYKDKDSNNEPRVVKIYVDPEMEKRAQAGEDVSFAQQEDVPNPKRYRNKTNALDGFDDAQRHYYDEIIRIKRVMMSKIPSAGQHIYKTINISKDLVEGIMDNSSGNPMAATVDYYKRKITRRPDDIGLGTDDNFKKNLEQILKTEKDTAKAVDKIKKAIAEALDQDSFMILDDRKVISVIERNKRDERGKAKELDVEKATSAIMDLIDSENYYLVDVDFAGRRIEKLPIYYTKSLKNPKMLTSDFSGAMIAYSAMAVNYEKMNQIINLLELMQTHINDRKVRQLDANKPVMSRIEVFDKVYKRYVVKTGAETNIGDRFNQYMKSVVYEQRTEDVGNVNLYGNVNVNITKVLEVLKDYTGILSLGLNIFSMVSNLAVGKLQQWIEAVGGEWFDLKDYAKAIGQYTANIGECVLEMSNPIKKNKLSLLIQMFDPMGDYFESLRNVHHGKNIVSRILGSGALGYIGLNAGEHVLHCQTMLAILNHIKLIDTTSPKRETISLYDALTVEENKDGTYRLELKKGLSYMRDMVNLEGTRETNPKYGTPIRDKDGKIKQEEVLLKDNNLTRFIIRTKKIIHGVNASLNGDFSADDKGVIHRWAVLKLIMQFRQWMPAHYMRRFARAHYDTNLEMFREGYYTTLAKFYKNLATDIAKGKWEQFRLESKQLSEHEQANIRRAYTEITIFGILIGLCKLGGKVGDEDRPWAEKMALYQLYRMRLETGSSTPCLKFFQNMITILNSPSASLDTLKKIEHAIHMNHMFDEIQSGRYEGWTVIERDLFKLLPYIPQIIKAVDFDDSLFTMYADLMK